MRKLLPIFMAVFLFAVSGNLRAQNDPRAGTWKLNAVKSKFNPGPPRKSETRVYEISGDTMNVKVDRVNADGSSQKYSYTSKGDGKDSPISGQGAGGSDTIAIRKIDAYTTESVSKKGSKELFTTKSVVSKDGRVLTLTSKGKDSDGKPLNNLALYDKQVTTTSK